jgi:hypothetical protein
VMSSVSACMLARIASRGARRSNGWRKNASVCTLPTEPYRHWADPGRQRARLRAARGQISMTLDTRCARSRISLERSTLAGALGDVVGHRLEHEEAAT